MSTKPTPNNAADCGLVQLPRIEDPRGNLTFIEGGRHVPFDIRRVYYLYDVPGGADRGGHAHKQLRQLIVAASGSFDVTVGPRARPGNWLPTGGVDKYLLVLRLYDTPIGMAMRTGRDAPMPAITKRACL